MGPHQDPGLPPLLPASDFTDDTVLTVATAGNARCYKDFGRRYPGRGCGASFVHWLARKDDAPTRQIPKTMQMSFVRNALRIRLGSSI